MKDIIKNYYLNQKVNLNNKSSFISSELSLEVEKIRNSIKKYFSWEGEVVFFPNPYYAKKLLLENFFEYSFFSNYSDNYLFANYRHAVINSPEEIPELNKSFLFWEGNFPKNLFVKPKFLCVEQSENKEILEQSDFFLFTPIQGITILGFKINLEPFFLGASAILYLSREGYEVNKGINRFDCRTGNYALLLALSKYFEKRQ